MTDSLAYEKALQASYESIIRQYEAVSQASRSMQEPPPRALTWFEMVLAYEEPRWGRGKRRWRRRHERIARLEADVLGLGTYDILPWVTIGW